MLLSNLNLLATAPDGVAKLRELILTLAVQGKLVPQDASDESASALLKKIRAEKDRLMAEGKIKRDKPLAEIEEEEKPFGLPEGWEWVRLANAVVKITDGEHLSPPKAEGGMPLLTAKDVTSEGLRFESTQFVSTENGQKYRERCNPARGDVLICSRGTIGRCAAVETDQVFCLMGSVILLKVPAQISYSYLLAYLTTGLAQTWMRGVTSATAVSALYLKDVARCLIPVPPLAEQSRIVIRVEELMRLCDALQAKARLEATQHEQLVRTLLASLTAPTVPNTTPQAQADAIQESWHRVATHFDLLLDRPEAVDALEQTILQLAVRGLLVPQDPKDEPASQLLNRLLGGSVVGTPQTQSDIEAPFPIPKDWSWVTLASLSKSMSNGLYKPAKFYSEAGTACVRMYNIQDGALDLRKIMRLEVTPSELEQYSLEPGDLLVNRVNSRELVGKCAVVAAHHEPLVYEAMNIRIRLVDMVNMPSYVNLVLRTKRVRELFQGDAKQAVGQASINQTQVGSVVIPLPPLAEQSRIVARVASLRALCADLRQRLTTVRTQQALLAEVLVKEVA